MSETMAELEIEQHLDAVIQGEECPECGYPINDEPGCQCDELDGLDLEEQLDHLLSLTGAQ